jgi:hypothetical protein
MGGPVLDFETWRRAAHLSKQPVVKIGFEKARLQSCGKTQLKVQKRQGMASAVPQPQ